MKSTKPHKERVSYTPEQFAALEKENLRLHKRVIELEAENVSLRNGAVAAIEGKPLKNLTNQELQWIARGKKRKHGIS